MHGALGTLSGLTTTSRALGVGASVKTKAIEHIKNMEYTGRVGAGALNPEGLAIAPTSPTALVRHGRPASCLLLHLLGARSQRALWHG